MSEASLDPAPDESLAAEVRHLPVPSTAAEPALPDVLEPAGPLTVAAEQAPALPAPIVAAAGGFLVGIATWALTRFLRPSPRRVAVGRLRRRERPLQVAGTRSFLVDVHLIRR